MAWEEGREGRRKSYGYPEKNTDKITGLRPSNVLFIIANLKLNIESINTVLKYSPS
jgi:hypothetical protein